MWSGGRSDGIDPETGKKYPTMSYAISQGLYHPRCKDSHTTYFPGISTADDTWTKKELEDIGIQAKQEARQQYAERQAEKFERLAKYSLDEDNRRAYATKERAWNQILKECGHKVVCRKTEMNRKEIMSNKYRRKVDMLPESEQIRKLVWSEMVDMVKKRSGTEFESLVFINTETNIVKRSLNSRLVRAVEPTKKMKNMVNSSKDYSIISIHNHPGSSVPSWPDIVVAAKRKYKYGLIAAHDGTIFKYRIVSEPKRVFYVSAVAKLDKVGYTEDSLKEFCNTIRAAGVEMEVL